MSTIKIAGIKEGSLVDGVGVRLSFFFSGCLHNQSIQKNLKQFLKQNDEY